MSDTIYIEEGQVSPWQHRAMLKRWRSKYRTVELRNGSVLRVSERHFRPIKPAARRKWYAWQWAADYAAKCREGK